MHYEFSPDFYTHIDSIDNEHGRLFELASEAHDLLYGDYREDKYDDIVAILNELRDYTKTHFAHEEAYMAEINFPHRFSQMYQHRLFIDKLDSINLKKLDEHQQAGLLDVIDFLAKWLVNHIKNMDRRIPDKNGVAAKPGLRD